MANRAEGDEVPIPTLPYRDDLVERVKRGVFVVEVANVKAEVYNGPTNLDSKNQLT